MRIQFVLGTDMENTVDIEVAEVPTEEQVKAIEDEIFNTMDKWEEENGDFSEFDYYMCCYDAVQKKRAFIILSIIGRNTKHFGLKRKI